MIRFLHTHPVTALYLASVVLAAWTAGLAQQAVTR